MKANLIKPFKLFYTVLDINEKGILTEDKIWICVLLMDKTMWLVRLMI